MARAASGNVHRRVHADMLPTRATYHGKDARDATPMELADPAWTVRPGYPVEQREVEARLRDRGWLRAFRDIARATR